jgi:predicted deacylase
MERVIFDSGRPGPTLLVTGGVHGNEHCGPKAIRQVVAEIASGALQLKRGKLIAVPVVNHLAYERNVRFVDENLNRIFMHHDHPKTHEQRVANEILPLIDECNFFLDLHSVHALDAPPFCFIDNDKPEHQAFVKAMGLEYILTGWGRLYAGAGLNQPASTDYAQSRGKIAACVECGGHDDASSPDVARACILRALRHLGMTDGGEAPLRPATLVEFSSVVIKERDGHLARAWRDLDPIRPGDVIAEYEDGQKVVADRSGFILLPFADATQGAEWFYIGEVKAGLEQPRDSRSAIHTPS